MGHEKIFSRKNTLRQYSERTYIESGNGRGNGNGSAPPPPSSGCLLDIAIGCDSSNSLNFTGLWVSENDFVREFVTAMDALMDGSIGGVAGSGTSDVQIGTYTWTNVHPFLPQSRIVRYMTDASSLIESDTNISLGNNVLGTMTGGGDNYNEAVLHGLDVLNNFSGSALGNRSSQPNYRRILIIVTDATSLGACDPNWFTGAANMGNDVWNVGTNAGNPAMDIEVYALVVHSASLPPSNWQGIISCLAQNPAQFPVGTIEHGTGTALGALGTTLANTICAPPPATWLCSGTSTTLIDRYNIPVAAWTCYDDGSGTNNPSQTACEVNCPPESYNCTNAPLWMCLDPGNGLGQFSVANNYPNTIPYQSLIDACEDDCYEVSYNCSGASGIVLPQPIGYIAPWNCYDPLDGTGQYTDANQGGISGAGSAACQAACYEESFECSGALGFTSPNPLIGTVLPWNCYDPLNGTGQYTDANSGGNPGDGSAACQAACIAPPPVTYICSGASGAGHPQGTAWACYDDGSGTGNPSQTVCQANCYLESYNCSGALGEWDNAGNWISAWNCWDPLDGTGWYVTPNFTNPLQDCNNYCVAPVQTWTCSGASGAIDLNQNIIPPWDCYDDGLGTGNPNQTACQAACQPPAESYFCSGLDIGPTHDPSGNIIGPWDCWDPQDGSGTYSVANGYLNPYIDCQTYCVKPPPESYNCSVLPSDLGPGTSPFPWTCYDPGTGLGQFSVANGYLNPLQDCLAVCKDPDTTVVVTPFCPRIISCPCGWDSVVLPGNVYNCELSDASGLLATMPAIEKCMEFPNPDPTGNPIAAQIGDIWEHQGNFGGYSWIAAVVVDNSMQTTSTTSLEQYTTC